MKSFLYDAQAKTLTVFPTISQAHEARKAINLGVAFSLESATEVAQDLTTQTLQDIIEAATGKRPGRFANKDKGIFAMLKALEAVEAPQETAPTARGRKTTAIHATPIGDQHKKRGMAKVIFDLVFSGIADSTEIAKQGNVKHSYVLLCLRDGAEQGIVSLS